VAVVPVVPVVLGGGAGGGGCRWRWGLMKPIIKCTAHSNRGIVNILLQ
jgi:hypothetical protein